jgi:type VI secretion system protein ImpB
MMSEGSIPPRERLNVRYKSATEGQPERELPLKLLMLGDYTGRPDERYLEDRKPVSINKLTFDKVMQEHNLALTLEVPNRLIDEKEPEMTINLQFKTLRDFEPRNIVEQVPRLKRLLELRQALEALKAPLGDKREFRREIQRILNDEELWKRLLKELNIEEKPEVKQ